MDEKIKTWLLRFPAKENPNMEKALFDWPIVLQYDVKAKYRLISRKFSGMKVFHPSVRLFNQPKATRVCIRSINQSNRSISVPLLFLFCSRVFISRSFENRSIPQRGELARRVMFHSQLNRRTRILTSSDNWFTFVSSGIRGDLNSWRKVRIDSQIWDLVEDRFIYLAEVLQGDEQDQYPRNFEPRLWALLDR